MLTGTRRKFLLLIIPICIAIAIYPIPFEGKQVVSLDAPLATTFDVLVDHLWKFHPYIIRVTELEKINATCTYYQIEDRLQALPPFQFSYTTSYYVALNIDRTNYCLTSEVQTPFYIMRAYHQYCMHQNTLTATTTIITDQFSGSAWMMFKWYIERNMFKSHKATLEKLRKEMMIYSTD